MAVRGGAWGGSAGGPVVSGCAGWCPWAGGSRRPCWSGVVRERGDRPGHGAGRRSEVPFVSCLLTVVRGPAFPACLPGLFGPLSVFLVLLYCDGVRPYWFLLGLPALLALPFRSCCPAPAGRTGRFCRFHRSGRTGCFCRLLLLASLLPVHGLRRFGPCWSSGSAGRCPVDLIAVALPAVPAGPCRPLPALWALPAVPAVGPGSGPWSCGCRRWFLPVPSFRAHRPSRSCRAGGVGCSCRSSGLTALASLVLAVLASAGAWCLVPGARAVGCVLLWGGWPVRGVGRPVRCPLVPLLVVRCPLFLFPVPVVPVRVSLPRCPLALSVSRCLLALLVCPRPCSGGPWPCAGVGVWAVGVRGRVTVAAVGAVAAGAGRGWWVRGWGCGWCGWWFGSW